MSKNDSSKKSSFVVTGITGLVSQGLTWPFEFLKTTKQLPNFKNVAITQVAKNIIKTKGFTYMYRGIAPQLISAAPRASVRFSVYEQLKQRMQNKDGTIDPLARFWCGLMAGGVEAATVMTPAEVIKVQTIDKGKTALESIKHIYKTNGLRGFYTGVRETSLRQATTQGTSFMVYEQCKKYLDNTNNAYVKSSSGLLAGIIGGTSAVLVNNPIDAIKTYKQSKYENETFINIAKRIYTKKGPLGFYNGATLRIMRVAPLHGLTFFMYDFLNNMLQK